MNIEVFEHAETTLVTEWDCRGLRYKLYRVPREAIDEGSNEPDAYLLHGLDNGNVRRVEVLIDTAYGREVDGVEECERALTGDMIRELGIITTRDESGRHFTEWSDHFDILGALGFVAIDRPIHAKTGIPYSQEYWSVEVTAAGREVVENNPA